MHKILDEHPNIAMARGKEINYFLENECKPFDYKDYLTYFKIVDETRFLGEASPQYTSGERDERVFQRMETALPRANYIYMLRDPMDRIKSMYFHRLRMGEMNVTLTEIVESSDLYIKGSNYPHYLKILKEQHGIEPYLIEFTEFIGSPRECIKKLLKLNGLDSECIKSEGIDHFNVGYKVGISSLNSPIRYKILQTIRKLIQPHNERIPKKWKDEFKKLIAGKDGIDRDGEDIIGQEIEIWNKNKDLFLAIKKEMSETYNVSTDHWYKRFQDTD